MFEVLETVGLN